MKRTFISVLLNILFSAVKKNVFISCTKKSTEIRTNKEGCRLLEKKKEKEGRFPLICIDLKYLLLKIIENGHQLMPCSIC